MPDLPQFEILTEANFLLYCAKHYDNPHCLSMEEFQEDINRFKYIKRLFNKYKDTDELRERLILNHIVILYNIFGSHATRMLFLKLKDYEPQLKPFLILLNRLPEKIYGIGVEGRTINTLDIKLDQKIIDALRKI